MEGQSQCNRLDLVKRELVRKKVLVIVDLTVPLAFYRRLFPLGPSQC